MTEAELQAIERKLPWDVPQMAGAQTTVTAGEIRALIAEVRRREEPSGRPEYTGPCAGLHKRIRLTDDAPRPESERDAERWKAGGQLGFPEFCGHADDAPGGAGWYHHRLCPPITETTHWFSSADDAMDAAIDAARAQEKPHAEK